MLKNLILLIIRVLDSITEWTGKIIAWLTLLMVIGVVVVLILRNLFEVSAIAAQESISYMHALVFMLGAAYTLKHDQHVRVDVFYHNFSDRKKAWVNIIGFVFLLTPVAGLIIYYCYGYVAFNWELKEGSNQPGGLPYLYLLKSLLLLLPISLLMQGLADLLRNSLFLTGQIESPYAATAATEQSEVSHV